MFKLLSANLQRLLLNRLFWFTLLAVVAMEGAICFQLQRQGPLPLEVALFIFLQTIGILAAIFLSLFYGTEYQDGTMRNKLIVGHKRSSIYFANFITGAVAITLLFLAGLLTGLGLGLLMYEPLQNEVSHVLLAGVVAWLACMTMAALFNLIGMLSTNKSVSAILAILSAFGLLFSALYIYQRLAKPGILTGLKRKIYELIFELNPNGQILQVMSLNVDLPSKMILYSLLLIFIATISGVFFFSKKDLK
ncbi:ABC transporter permease subunit [Candidatus Enterococcus ferrettii]|uniref:ABC transporter permease n=1 Tax=Candidatus Enterococcus ferrettii TaxID=2815324 RepID=A0ABV0EPC8_9ENTE|nr:ABC transporter permease subunit [Enterococcus sp. 665A]MBO1340036.1 ABC transporter permease subunit [Enterococcus sp. 665A]